MGRMVHVKWLISQTKYGFHFQDISGKTIIKTDVRVEGLVELHPSTLR